MDWSYYSPSAFLELGVRLAVSPWGALQLIADRFQPGAHMHRASSEPTRVSVLNCNRLR
jgi:hypothetical protein